LKGKWTVEEDKLLEKLVHKYGQSWKVIANELNNGRISKQCRQRWLEVLDPNLKKGPFMIQEDELILEIQKIHGNHWAKIAHFLPGRCPTSIKKRYFQLVKNQQVLTSPNDSQVQLQEQDNSNVNKSPMKTHKQLASDETNIIKQKAILPQTQNQPVPSYLTYPPYGVQINQVSQFGYFQYPMLMGPVTLSSGLGPLFVPFPLFMPVQVSNQNYQQKNINYVENNGLQGQKANIKMHTSINSSTTNASQLCKNVSKVERTDVQENDNNQKYEDKSSEETLNFFQNNQIFNNTRNFCKEEFQYEIIDGSDFEDLFPFSDNEIGF